MRVTFVTQSSWPSVGGMETSLGYLTRQLGSHHEVRVIARRIDNGSHSLLLNTIRKPPGFEPFPDGPVLVEQLRFPAARRAMAAPLVTQVIPIVGRWAHVRGRGPLGDYFARVMSPVIADLCRDSDIVHVWGPDLLSLAAVRAAQRNRQPAVITPFAFAGAWGTDVASAEACRSATALIAQSETDGEVYRELGVAPERIVPCGACSPAMRPGGGAALRDRYGIFGRLVLFLAVRSPRKGGDVLLDAAPLVTAEHPDTTFAFVGPGEPIPELPGVRILDVDAVDQEGASAWLDACDLMCLPSFSEILPISILEAWTLAKPVVTSDIPVLAELVNGRGGGLAVPRDAHAVARAICELLADPERARRLGRAGRAAWESRFSIEQVTACHERLYESLARSRR